MADEGDQMHMEQQSSAGKWILIVLAILVIAGFAYAHYATHMAMLNLTQAVANNQTAVKELQNRIQQAEAEEETLASQAGMTKKDLLQRTAALQAEQRAAEASP